MRIPKEVSIVLEEYLALLIDYFPETIEGVYLHGSIAIDAYVHNSSDIDIITVTKRRFTDNDLEALSHIHSSLAEKYKRPELDGVYIIWEDLGKIYSQASDGNEKYVFYNDGKLEYGHYFNFNPVTWWTLKHRGIKVLGIDIEELDIDVQTSSLISYVHQNMNLYWVHYVKKVKEDIDIIVNLPTYQIDDAVEWCVLGLLRQLYTLKEADILSKLEAGSYGIQQLSEKWHPIINEAINIRNGIEDDVFPTERDRVTAAVDFCTYLIDYCNSFIKT